MGKKVGRPSKYDGIDLKQVAKLAELGWTDQQMAEFFEVSLRTWNRYKGQYDEFCHTLKNWKRDADENVERSLYERALGYSCPEDKIFIHEGEPVIVPTVKHYPPDPTSMIFWLKNRQPKKWRDNPDGAVSDDQLARVFEAAAKVMGEHV